MAKPLAVLQGLSRLLAIPVESLPVGEPHTDSATARDGAVVGAEPLAPDMCRRIEELVKLRHRAGGRDAGGRRVFVLPFWLTADSAWRARTRSGSILVHVDTAGGRRVTVSGVTDNRRLGSVALSPRKPEAWRRRCIARTAARIRRDLTLVLGSVASDPAWLSEMASAPEAAERAAIAVWNRFLEAAAVPAGLRIPGFELSVAELLEVRGEQTGNGNREWFANRWPAAAAALLRGGEAEEMLRRLDGSRAAAAEIATKTFCCNRKQDCERARRMVQAIPRYRDDRGLARVLAGCGPLVDVHIRAIVMHANYDDGSLLARMAQRSQYAREHMALAAAVATNPLFRTSECRMKVGELIARTLAGSGYDPSELVPEVVARALVAVSADCLAAYAAARTSDIEADALEKGVLALGAVMSGPRWRLSPALLAAFVKRSRAQAALVYRRETGSGSGDAPWPAPATWRSDEHASLHGAHLAPLSSADDLRAEGGAMTACLESERFRRSLSLGRLTMFAVRVGQDRATLILRAVDEGGQIVKYRISGLRGPRNEVPGRCCQKAARHLVNRLNAGLPVAAPAALSQRRLLIEDTWVNYNLDKHVADERWPLYASCLPGRFAATSPAAVVGQWSRAG